MTRDRSTSRKRSARSRSQTGRILQQPCRYCLKITCTRSPCEYWHPPECQFYKLNGDAKQEKSGSRTTMLKNNQVKKQRKSSENGTSDDKGAVPLVKTVPQLGCLARLRARTSEKNEVSEKPQAESCGINPRGKIQTVYATSSKYPWKLRTIAWHNTSQDSSSTKCLRCEIWGLITRIDWKTRAMRSRQSRGICQQ